jgi:hypothetical protein
MLVAAQPSLRNPAFWRPRRRALAKSHRAVNNARIPRRPVLLNLQPFARRCPRARWPMRRTLRPVRLQKIFEPWLRFRFVPGGRRRIYAKQMIILRASGLNAQQAGLLENRSPA